MTWTSYSAEEARHAVQLLVEVEQAMRRLLPFSELESLLRRIRQYLVDLGVRIE